MRRLLIALGLCLLTVSLDAGQVRLRFSVAVVDATAPVVTITDPNGGTSPFDAGSTTPLTTLAGTCTDNGLVSQVTWTNSLGGSGTATGTTSWSVPSINLLTGTNTITVTCTDTSSNTHQDTLAVTYAPAGGGSGCNGSCLFETSFTTGQGWTADVANQDADGVPCGSLQGFNSYQPGVTNALSGQSENGNCSEVTTAANYSGGAGGRGYRHVFSDGTNENAGTIKFNFTAAQAIWLSYRIRYSTIANMWGGGNPHYIKQYHCPGVPVCPIIGYQGTGWGFNVNGATNYSSSLTWTELFGSGTSDGNFHCFDFHFNFTTSRAVIYIDGTNYMDRSDINWLTQEGLTTWQPSNQNVAQNGGATDHYADYDDIRIDNDLASATTRIGCPGAGG